jgi:hypothetical protein
MVSHNQQNYPNPWICWVGGVLFIVIVLPSRGCIQEIKLMKLDHLTHGLFLT